MKIIKQIPMQIISFFAAMLVVSFGLILNVLTIIPFIITRLLKGIKYIFSSDKGSNTTTIKQS